MIPFRKIPSIFVLFTFPLAAIGRDTPLPALGMNASNFDPVHFTTSFPFTNLFKCADPFANHTDGVALDEHGYPVSLNAGQEARTIVFVGDRLPNGDYTLMWDGQGSGRLRVAGQDHDFNSTIGSSLVIPVQEYGSEIVIELIISSTDTQNPLHNLRLYLPGYGDSSGTYTDPFKDFFRDFGVVRVMWWSGPWAGSENLVQWEDRARVQDFTWSLESDDTRALPYEVLIELANAVDRDLWISIPHLADDDFMAQAAALIQDSLKPNLKVWVEYTNEHWMGATPANTWLHEVERPRLIQELGLDPDADFYLFHAYGYHSARLLSLFDSVFNDDSRIIGVVAGQNGYDAPLRHAMEQIESMGQLNLVDAFSFAPYFGISEGYDYARLQAALDSGSVIDELKYLIDEVFVDDGDEWGVGRHNHLMAQLAEQHGKDLVAYEGGQHFSNWTGEDIAEDLIVSVNRHPDMYEAYQYYLDSWDSLGGKTMVLFDAISQALNGQAFGHKEYWDQPLSEAHKLRAALDWQAGAVNPVLPHSPLSSVAYMLRYNKLYLTPGSRARIYDVSGRQLLQTKKGQTLLNLAPLSTGHYIANIRNGKGAARGVPFVKR